MSNISEQYFIAAFCIKQRYGTKGLKMPVDPVCSLLWEAKSGYTAVLNDF